MNFLIDTPNAPIATLLLAHGAGAGMEHPWMAAMATALCEHNIQVMRFEFPYMEKRREDGKKRPPDRQPKLLAYFTEAVLDAASRSDLPVFIAGKSMGGRMATLLAAEQPTLSITGVIAYGFPLHPPGKPDSGRAEHLRTAKFPTLLIQGERDTFGTQTEIEQLPVSDRVSSQFLTDGDHSFKPRKASGFTQQAHILGAAEYTADFIRKALNRDLKG